MNHHSPNDTANDRMARRATPTPPPGASGRAPRSAMSTNTASRQTAPRQ